MTTAEEAAARGFTALTTHFHDSEAALMESVCNNLRRGKIPFILVTVGHGIREIWRLGRVQMPDPTLSVVKVKGDKK